VVYFPKLSTDCFKDGSEILLSFSASALFADATRDLKASISCLRDSVAAVTTLVAHAVKSSRFCGLFTIRSVLSPDILKYVPAFDGQLFQQNASF
jgi:hypothetical protein